MRKIITIVCLVALFAFIAGSAHARMPMPYTRPQTTVVHNHKDSGQALTYLFAGVIVGIVIQEYATRCQNGIICSRF